MTGRISIPALRDDFMARAKASHEDILALVEAVEAAQEFMGAAHGTNHAALLAALARFDFGEDT